MFDIGWSELAVVALVALLVIGPKDLPKAMRTAALWIRKIRALANEFQSGLNDIVREAELDELKQDIDKATSVDLKHEIGKHIDPSGEVERSLDLHDDLHDSDTETTPAEHAEAEHAEAIEPSGETVESETTSDTESTPAVEHTPAAPPVTADEATNQPEPVEAGAESSTAEGERAAKT